MTRQWGWVLVLLGLVVLANAGPVGVWTLLYVNATQPQHNGTHVNILGAETQCVVEEGGKFLTAPLDQCTSLPGARPAYGELGYGALLDRYSSALVNAYLVGFALPGYTERPDFNLVRYAFKYVKDYFYYEYQGRVILNEVETRAWGVLPRSDYCNTNSQLQALLADVVAYMYNTWRIKISNGSLVYVYLVGNLPCLSGDLGGAYGVATVKTPYGTVTARAVVIFHNNRNLRNLHLATLATYGALNPQQLACTGPFLSVNDGPLLMSRWSYGTSYGWPDGYYYTPLPFMIPAFMKSWLTGIRVNMSALVPDRLYTWELNSPTRFVNATHLWISGTPSHSLSFRFMYHSLGGILTALRCLVLCLPRAELRGFTMWIRGIRCIIVDIPFGTMSGYINSEYTWRVGEIPLIGCGRVWGVFLIMWARGVRLLTR
jgi:hypothetical protein